MYMEKIEEALGDANHNHLLREYQLVRTIENHDGKKQPIRSCVMIIMVI